MSQIRLIPSGRLPIDCRSLKCTGVAASRTSCARLGFCNDGHRETPIDLTKPLDLPCCKVRWRSQAPADLDHTWWQYLAAHPSLFRHYHMSTPQLHAFLLPGNEINYPAAETHVLSVKNRSVMNVASATKKVGTTSYTTKRFSAHNGIANFGTDGAYFHVLSPLLRDLGCPPVGSHKQAP